MFSYPPIDEEILALLRNREEFVVIGHVSPDGDCLSSQMAMNSMLLKMGKTVHMANAGPFDRSEISHLRSDFLNHIDDELKQRNPLIVVVDCSSPERIGHLAEEIEGLTTVVFDHHSSGEQFGTYRYIVPRSVSTTLIIMQLYKALDVEISQEIAEHLFFGFATDSGFFRFINAYRGETLRLAAELVDLGVSPNVMNDRMTGGKSFGYIKYLGKLIDRSESLFDGKVMISSSCLEDSKQYITTDKPSDSLYTMLLSVQGVEVVLFFKELEGGRTEVGFRSSHQSSINVGALAESFGGGGHKKAAGATVNKPIQETRKLLLEAVEKMLKA
ncbi:bifunctional oligoribonuclease/PAP phosphatase NrnA [Sphaerochaeta sp. S2]|uniref:DHH family phosphoesterase n=1 Tax=Sphaerochaeta sp. S2 TaxID=2798868 RepID=UPI0018EA0ED1|nr:DHH family phosphoesterase [Sphaerochaeta sp. S2]MBJ2357212.1 DHH family phosphoesterase [Sphaerochaeta sp. S2]MCK9347520.1 DHH family phosphoesterase [Sphaerochaeta sp.]MDY0243536.1 DHH family phosphoesterase [Sphaerochaeta sp.]